jgi:cation diffusion facilitator family transporter
VEAATRNLAGRAFRIGLIGNAVAALLKLLIGYAAGSRALIADGGHSLANVALAGAAWSVHRLSSRSGRRPFGRGKLEAFAALLFGLVFVLAGLLLVAYAWTSSARPEPGFARDSAIWLALLSIAANLAGAWFVRRAEDEEHSHALALLAKGLVSDAIASGLVVLAWFGTAAGHDFADVIGAFAVGCVVLVLGWRFGWNGFDALLDRADPELSSAVADTVRRLDRVKGVGEVDAYPMGRRFEIDVEVAVDPHLTVEEAGRIAAAVETAVLRAHPKVAEAYVRTSPAAGAPEPKS